MRTQRRNFIQGRLVLITIFRKPAVIIFITCFAVVSCNSSKIESTQIGNLYFPLSNNLQLNYRSSLTDNIVTINISKSGKKDSDEFLFDRFPFIWNLDSSVNVFVKNDGEVICKFFGEDFIFLPSMEKMKSGYKWETQEWNAVISNQSSISLSNKTYNGVYKVSYNLSITYNAEIWFAKGVGVIKWGFNRVNPPTPEFEYFELIVS